MTVSTVDQALKADELLRDYEDRYGEAELRIKERADCFSMPVPSPLVEMEMERIAARKESRRRWNGPARDQQETS